MPIPAPLEVEDGVTLITLADMIALQTAVNDLIGVVTEQAALIDSLTSGGYATQEYVDNAVRGHSDADADVHGAVATENQRVAVMKGGGKVINADRTGASPVGQYDNDVWFGVPA